MIGILLTGLMLYEVLEGIIGLELALGGFLLGLFLGFIATRMFIIHWQLEFMEEPIQVNIEKKVLERLLEHDCCGYGVSETIETLINRLESESEPTKKTKAKSCKRK